MWRLTITRKYEQQGIQDMYPCKDTIELLFDDYSQAKGIIEDVRAFGTNGDYEYTFVYEKGANK